MKLSVIRELSGKRPGGMRKLAVDIDMSEANLHRCVRNNDISAGNLEKIARLLNVSIAVFFDDDVRPALSNNLDIQQDKDVRLNASLIQLCKDLVHNYQQRDEVIGKLVSTVKCME